MSDSKDAFSHSNLNSKVRTDDLNTTKAIDEKLQSQVSLRAAITALDDDLQTFGINLSEETLHQTVAGLSLVTLRGKPQGKDTFGTSPPFCRSKNPTKDARK